MSYQAVAVGLSVGVVIGDLTVGVVIGDLTVGVVIGDLTVGVVMGDLTVGVLVIDRVGSGDRMVGSAIAIAVEAATTVPMTPSVTRTVRDLFTFASTR